MTAGTLTARPARTSEIDTVPALCLAAFADEAVTAWVLAEPNAPLAAMQETFTASLVAAVEAEALVVAVTAAGDAVGASIWIDSDGTSPDNLMPAGDAPTSGLRYGLDRARRLGLPTYLEASSPQSRKLYARHGFVDHGTPLPLPDSGPVLQPMWHEA